MRYRDRTAIEYLFLKSGNTKPDDPRTLLNLTTGAGPAAAVIQGLKDLFSKTFGWPP